MDYTEYWQRRIDKAETTITDRHKEIVKVIVHNFPSGNAQVLDLGCGEGHIEHLLPERFDIYACDISTVQVSNDELPNCHFTEVDLNKQIPFKEMKFDVVIASEVLEHLAKPYPVLAQLKNWLKDGGICLITIPNISNRQFVRQLAKGIYPFDWSHCQFWSITEFKRLLKTNGLEIAACYPTQYIFPQLPRLLNPAYKLFYGLGRLCPMAYGEQFLFVCHKS